LKKLHNFNIKFTDNIEDILANPSEWAERVAEELMVEQCIPRYLKAKKLGKELAYELTDKDEL
tara:strand:+ start:878 stop:1066 length:189 start_codon:yes stop_codon:yes gene_type:complete